jgi:hypothetical protein
MLTESKKLQDPWGSTEDQLLLHLAGNGNDNKNCYGMVQIGLEVQYYKYELGVFSKVGGRMNLVTHANDVVAWSGYIKDNLMPCA